MKGLLFHELGRLLPPSHELRVSDTDDLDADVQQEIVRTLSGQKLTRIGDGVFSYVFWHDRTIAPHASG